MTYDSELSSEDDIERTIVKSGMFQDTFTVLGIQDLPFATRLTVKETYKGSSRSYGRILGILTDNFVGP